MFWFPARSCLLLSLLSFTCGKTAILQKQFDMLHLLLWQHPLCLKFNSGSMRHKGFQLKDTRFSYDLCCYFMIVTAILLWTRLPVYFNIECICHHFAMHTWMDDLLQIIERNETLLSIYCYRFANVSSQFCCFHLPNTLRLGTQKPINQSRSQREKITVVVLVVVAISDKESER